MAMLFSIGKNLTAGTANTIFTVPDGHHAKVSMLWIANSTGSTKSIQGSWVKADGTIIPFQGAKSVASGETLKFGGEYGYFLIMKDGDYLRLTPEASSTFSCLCTFELIPYPASDYF